MGNALFLHHHVRERGPVRQGDLHHVLPRCEALQVEAFEARALAAHEATLQVVKLDLTWLHVGRVLQADLVLGGVGVEGVGADDTSRFRRGFNAVVVDEELEIVVGYTTFLHFTAYHKSSFC